MQLFTIYCSPVKQIGSSVLDFITTLITEKFALICLCFLSKDSSVKPNTLFIIICSSSTFISRTKT